MAKGKIILGTLSIIVALITFFEVLGDILSGMDYFPILPSLIILSLGTLGITVVRKGLSKGLSRRRKSY